MWGYLENSSLAGNPLWRIALFCVILLCTLVVGKILQFILSRVGSKLVDRGKRVSAAAFISTSKSAFYLLGVIGLKVGFAFVEIDEKFAGIISGVTSSLVAASIGYTLYAAVDVVNVWLARIASKTEHKMDDMLVPLVRKSLRVTIVIFTLLQIATILSDKPLTSILAGLGIGGLAVALASQDTLKNLFGSIVLFGDKPFELGDRVVVDEYDGSVEEVGFRSTRIRTLEGHLVTIPNGELVNKSIRNIGRRPNIRRVFDIGVTYDTTPDKVELAMQIVKQVLNNHEGMHHDYPPRIFFSEFADSALTIRVMYWYHPASYWDYMSFSEKVNLEILKRFNAEGIEFAFPSQTIYLAGNNS